MNVMFVLIVENTFISCNDIITDKIINYNCGGITKQNIFSYLLLPTLDFWHVNYILISFNKSYNNTYV